MAQVMNHRMSLTAVLALTTLVTGCTSIGGSQVGASSQKDLVPQGAVVAVHLTPAKGNLLDHMTMTGLPSARYALFLSPSSFASSASLLAFDVDAKCGAAGDGGTGAADGGTAGGAHFISASDQTADCVANGLTTDGSAVSVLVVVGESVSTLSTADSGHDQYLALRALDGKSLPAKVSLTVNDLTIGTQDEPNGPSIDPITLP